MLKNPNPDQYTHVPNKPSAKMYEYVVLNPSSHKIGLVSVSALLYANDDAFFAGQNCGDTFIGEMDYNLNDAGLLDAVEAFALTQFSGFESCSPPVKPEVTIEK